MFYVFLGHRRSKISIPVGSFDFWVVCVLCYTLSLTHAPALYSYGLLASPGTDMPYLASSSAAG